MKRVQDINPSKFSLRSILNLPKHQKSISHIHKGYQFEAVAVKTLIIIWFWCSSVTRPLKLFSLFYRLQSKSLCFPGRLLELKATHSILQQTCIDHPHALLPPDTFPTPIFPHSRLLYSPSFSSAYTTVIIIYAMSNEPHHAKMCLRGFSTG